MNNKSGSERGDGLDCRCCARSQGECACGADWTPSEVYKLKKELSTQTERVRVLREALIKVKKVYISNVGHTDEGIPHKHCEVCWIDQALNQDSLGDGKDVVNG